MEKALKSKISEIGAKLGLPNDVVASLLKHESEIEFEVCLDKTKQCFRAYRIQHNSTLGPHKGGIRFHPSVSKPEVATLATLMTLKTSAVGLPLGGGKGGVAVDPKTLTREDLEELSRSYARYVAPYIGEDKDIPAPDVNTDSTVMDWMLDEYQKVTNQQTEAVFTGKSIEKGGSKGRSEATGLGGYYVLERILKNQDEKYPKTVAIQGFGNVGYHFAHLVASNKKYNLVAVSDSTSGIYSSSRLSLNPEKILLAKKTHRLVSSYAKQHPDIKIISNEKLLALDVDILVLAALSDAVNKDNMKNCQAKYIVELANNPISSTAHDYLVKKGKIIIPDIIANAGGVIVSYFEWLQNRQNQTWSKQKVYKKLKDHLFNAVDEIYDIVKAQGISYKDAAYEVAIARIAKNNKTT